MRAANIDAGSSGVRSGLSWNLIQFLNSRDRLSIGSHRAQRALWRRSLRIEPLECRHLMDAAGLASLVTPDWFADATEFVGPEHAGAATWTAQDTIERDGSSQTVTPNANLYDWIVQFDTAALDGIGAVSQTASLLVGGGIDFQVIRGLGMVGQVLVRSSGASFDAVHDWLADNLNVAVFEQDALRQFEVVPASNDPLAGNLWGMTAIDAQAAWGISTGTSNVVVAVIDTGIDYNHPDLAANIWTNPGEIAGNGIDDDGNGMVDDVHGYNFVANTGDPMDDNGHGTHVAGTIAAVGDNGRGVTGVNWSSSLMAMKFLNSQGQGSLSDAVRAINYVTLERTRYGVNVRVMNNSWGGGGFSSAMQNAIQAANDAGILFVAAAGNSGGNNDALPQYPANYTPANVLSVAASTQRDELAYFSCYGATSVDIAAPGVSIYSTLPNNRYGSYSGTSMATPHVTAVAALAWAVAPNASVAEIRNAILSGADPIATLNGKMVTGGRLNAFNTLQRLSSPVSPEPADPEPVTPPEVFATVGVYNASASAFSLKETSQEGASSRTFTYVPAQGQWISLAGDWDGDGVDTVGLYDVAQSRFYLRNSNDSGNANSAFAYGPAGSGWLPVVGDWNGDGADTVGLYNPTTSVFYLRNSNDGGYAHVAFAYGPANAGWLPIAGDWNGDCRDTIGLYAPGQSVFYLRDSNSTGFADRTFSYGSANSGWLPVVGDWNGDTVDTIGLYDRANAAFYQRNSNSAGYADTAFAFGAVGSSLTPVAGDWQGSGTSAKAIGSQSVGRSSASQTDFLSAAMPDVLAVSPILGEAIVWATTLDHASPAASRLVEASSLGVRDELFTRLAADDTEAAERRDVLPVPAHQRDSWLDSPSGRPALASSSRLGSALRAPSAKDGDERSSLAAAGLGPQEATARDLLDRQAADGLFAQLGCIRQL